MGTRGLPAAVSFETSDRRWKSWIPFLLLALLFHFLLFYLLKLDWIPSIPNEKKLEVSSIPPQELEKLRQKWKEKGLLLDQNKPKTKAPAPPDARYFSNQNRTVEKEQRARDSAVLPQPKSEGSQNQTPKETPPQTAKQKAEKPPLSSLSSLGIPLSAPKSRPEDETQDPAEKARTVDQQALLDNDLPVGGENLLNTQESVYYSFYARLYQAIAPLWESELHSVGYQTHVNPGDYFTEVDVVLDAQGSLRRIHQIKGSGIPEFDEAVQKAWEQVGRFPNPPSGLLDGQNQIHTGWTFHVHVGQGMNLNYSSPKRNY